MKSFFSYENLVGGYGLAFIFVIIAYLYDHPDTNIYFFLRDFELIKKLLVYAVATELIFLVLLGVICFIASIIICLNRAKLYPNEVISDEK